jgi:hypothetical protein
MEEQNEILSTVIFEGNRPGERVHWTNVVTPTRWSRGGEGGQVRHANPPALPCHLSALPIHGAAAGFPRGSQETIRSGEPVSQNQPAPMICSLAHNALLVRHSPHLLFKHSHRSRANPSGYGPHTCAPSVLQVCYSQRHRF